MNAPQGKWPNHWQRPTLAMRPEIDAPAECRFARVASSAPTSIYSPEGRRPVERIGHSSRKHGGPSNYWGGQNWGKPLLYSISNKKASNTSSISVIG